MTETNLAAPAMFLFFAAAVVAVFAFLSVVTWVTAPSKERQTRDRYALLKTLAEQPGENAVRVLDMLIREDERRIERKERDEQQGRILSGLIVTAVGAGLSAMLAIVGDHHAWAIGLIPLLIGCVLLGAALFTNRRASQARQSS